MFGFSNSFQCAEMSTDTVYHYHYTYFFQVFKYQIILTSMYSSKFPPNSLGWPTWGFLPILLFFGFGGKDGGLKGK